MATSTSKPASSASPKPSGDAQEDVAAAPASKPPLPEARSPGRGFRAPVVEAVRITTTTEVEVRLTRADDARPWSGPVRYTAEPFTVTGAPHKGHVREKNVLGSGRAFDLNGDGDVRDRFKASCSDGAFQLGKTLRLEPVMGGPAVARTYDYGSSEAPRQGSVREGGVGTMLYLPCADDGTVSLGWGPGPIEVREIPGPALMVLAFGNPALPPSIPADGVRREGAREGLVEQRLDLEVYEPVVDTPHWYAVAGTMAQLDPDAEEQIVRVFIEGDVEHVQIAVNEGKPGIPRARTYVATQTVGSR